MTTAEAVVAGTGAAAFGAVVGWVTYRTLRWKSGSVGLSDLSAVLGVVGGAAITSLFATPVLFGAYGIGLGVGFFGYYVAAGAEEKRIPPGTAPPSAPQPGGSRHGWMGSGNQGDGPGGSSGRPPN